MTMCRQIKSGAKALLLTMLVLSAGQNTRAQIAPQDDPIGTVYTYEEKSSSSSEKHVYTLVSKSSGTFTLRTNSHISDGKQTPLDMVYTIKDSALRLSMEQFLHSMMAPIMEHTEMKVKQLKISGELPCIPLYPIVGEDVAPSQFSVSAKVQGIPFKVKGKTLSHRALRTEKVKVPAGEYDAVVVEYVMKLNMTLVGVIPVKHTITTTNWIVPGRGVVKSVEKSKDGEEVTQLISIRTK